MKMLDIFGRIAVLGQSNPISVIIDKRLAKRIGTDGRRFKVIPCLKQRSLLFFRMQMHPFFCFFMK